MLSSGIIDLAIGLAFIFGATAALCSVITELISRFLGLRGAYLLLGLRELLDSGDQKIELSHAVEDFDTLRGLVQAAPRPSRFRAARPATEAAGPGKVTVSATSALLGSPILRSQGMTGQIMGRHLTMEAASPKDDQEKQGTPGPGTASRAGTPGRKAASMRARLPAGRLSSRRSLPSYISTRSFAEAVIDLVIPDKSGRTSMSEVRRGLAELPEGTMRTSLESLATDAGDDITRFRASVEHWYDDHMDRVSGWYKRRVGWITLAVGLVLVVLLNINAITIGRALYSDSATRSAVSAVAAKGNPCPASTSTPVPSPSSSSSAGQDQQDCFKRLEALVSSAAQAGLPLGWGAVPACSGPKTDCGWLAQRGITGPDGNFSWQVILVLIGFLITIVALTPGAQFWFGLVVKLNSLRSTGPPPATSGTSAS